MNTIYLAPSQHRKPRLAPDSERAVLAALGKSETPRTEACAIAVISPTRSVSVHNNLFFTSGGEKLVFVGEGQKEIHFQGNAYWADGDAFHVEWAGGNYRSISEWLEVAHDQERMGGRILAIDENPMLDGVGTGGTIGEPGLLATLGGYKLLPGSPLLRRGIPLSKAVGIDPGHHGFFGNPVPSREAPSIGAGLVSASEEIASKN